MPVQRPAEKNVVHCHTNMGSVFRIFSIIAYLLIFLQGSMILLPFGLMLMVGVFSAEPLMRVLLMSADITLLLLLILSTKKRTKWNTLIEAISFFVLLLPLLKIFTSFSFDWFNYFLFLFPVGCFITFFPLSIFLAHRKFTLNAKRLAANLESGSQPD
jgi:hypothetical protein